MELDTMLLPILVVIYLFLSFEENKINNGILLNYVFPNTCYEKSNSCTEKYP